MEYREELARHIPSALAYENGGYSTDITHYAAGTGERLVANFLEMLKDLKEN